MYLPPIASVAAIFLLPLKWTQTLNCPSTASSCKLPLSLVLGQTTGTYSFNSGMMYLESQTKWFHHPMKTHFFSITDLQPCIDFVPWHMDLPKPAVTASQSIRNVEKAFRREGNECTAAFEGQVVGKKQILTK